MSNNTPTGELDPASSLTIFLDADDQWRGLDLDSTDSILAQREALISHLEGLFAINASELPFLRRNTDLAWSLISARQAINDVFGPARVRLSLVRDPESQRAEDKLFAYVATGLSLAEALEALDRFDESWFLNHISSVGTRLNFDIDF